jgi:hypothetical protein
MDRLYSRELSVSLATKDPLHVHCSWDIDEISRTYHLLGYHNDCLDRESPVAVVEEILQRRSQ